MNYKDNITPHFLFHDALYLPSWQTYHIPSQQELDNLNKLFNKLEEIRTIINCPINIHVAIRPILNNPSSPHHGQDYNASIGGATHSAHRVGLAADWSVIGQSCDSLRATLLPHLESLNIRMEDKPNSNWVHIGLDYTPGHNRFFIP